MLGAIRNIVFRELCLKPLSDWNHSKVWKMSINGVSACPKAETCKRPHEDDTKEESKKLCTEESGVKKCEDEVSSKPGHKFLHKKKYILLLGYNGMNYHGMQINGTSIRTVELELFNALHKAGYITEEEKKENYLLKFQRSARTDKSVSAAHQVVSLKLASECKREEINAHLPADIRVFSILRVTKNFNSKHNCDGRTYSYLLPTQILSQEPLDNFKNDNYRITPELIEKVNGILRIYVGTHNFHNFTSKRHFDDPSARRYIMNFECGEPFVMEKEFIPLTVKGQSFMLHQVRKMVGAVIAVARGKAGPEVIEKAWLRPKIQIPLPPGDGLLLETPHFMLYDKKFGDDGIHQTLTWDDVEEEVQKFRREMIVVPIVRRELETLNLVNWVQEYIIHSEVVFRDLDEIEAEKSENAAKDGTAEESAATSEKSETKKEET